MGRLLKRRTKDNKWRLWTTISDGYLTDWLSEDEMKAAIAAEYENDCKLRVIELYMSFPYGYSDKDTSKRFSDNKGIMAYHKWHTEVLEHDNYYELVDEKLKGLIRKEA